MSCTYYSKNHLRDAGRNYDSKVHLLKRSNAVINDIPLKTDSHNIHESAEYALYLLDTEPEKYKKRINDIIETVLKFQIKDKNSARNGFWEYFYEKEVNGMPYIRLFERDSSMQNGRMAMTLVQILFQYREYFSADMYEKIRASVENTIYTFDIIYGNEYSIAFGPPSAYPVLVYGKMYNKEELTVTGRRILENIYMYTASNNSFYELNDVFKFSYTSEILSMLVRDIDDKECVKYGQYFYDKLWQDFSVNFHRYTMQLAGPFMGGSEKLTDEMCDFLDDALEGKFSGIHKERKKDYLSVCPRKYIRNFLENKSNRFEQKMICRGLVYPYFRQTVAATTYIREKYNVGTFNREINWEQRKTFIGYFGSQKDLYVFGTDVLHDGFSYTSSVNHCVQYNGSVLGHITMLTDGGDKHTDFDAPNPVLRVNDLRVRFYVKGDIDKLLINRIENGIEIEHDGVKLYYEVPYSNFDKLSVTHEIVRDKDVLCYDVVLYSGKEKFIDFTVMNCAILEYNFLITGTGKKKGEVYRTGIKGGKLLSKVNTPDCTLSLNTPVRPCKRVNALTEDEQFINGVKIEDQIAYKKRVQDNSEFVAMKIESENEFDSIKHIKNNSFSENCILISGLMNELSGSKYDDDVKRSILMLILKNLFEAARAYDFYYEEMINDKFLNIYKKHIFIDSPKKIISDILKIIKGFGNIDTSAMRSVNDVNIAERCKRVINENLLNPELSIQFAAEKLGCSVGYLSGAFKKYTGMKYVDYIQQEKISYAVEKLQERDITIKEVSEMLGYSSPNNFMRMFKKIKGKTISEFLHSKKRS